MNIYNRIISIICNFKAYNKDNTNLQGEMYAYSKKFAASDIWLLYPMPDEFRAGNDLDIKFDSGDGTVVHVYFVDVAKIENSLSRLRERLEIGG